VIELFTHQYLEIGCTCRDLPEMLVVNVAGSLLLLRTYVLQPWFYWNLLTINWQCITTLFSFWVGWIRNF